MSQEILNEKTEQSAPLLSPDEYSQDISDSESVHSEDMTVETSKASSLHPAFFIALWIGMSSLVILFNKWILDSAKFRYPIFLTSWHMFSSAVVTQIMARYTGYLDSRHTVPMTQRTYIRAILPIGLLFSLSLVCGNVTYLYLNVSFVQMLKAAAPIAVLLATWVFRLSEPSLAALGNICIIVVGVIIASLGEVKFNGLGVAYQLMGIVFEATRLVMIQRLLSAEFKMDPLVSLYYFAPVCAITNGVLALVFEAPHMTWADFERVGLITLGLNAAAAFLLNFASLLLIGKTSSLVLTLSGVFKNIMIVFASMLFFHDPVSGIQFFGFSVALGGLAYYQLGGAPAVRVFYGQAVTKFSDYRRPSEADPISAVEAQQVTVTPKSEDEPKSPGFKSA
ncbi:TPT-domain-containing protein [Aureobasidium pullulans]|uniref:TPT-domain-containing protein n=1 Tax=Aureobasidium pullulans TaxID=5580 RepID=A0A4S9WF45_AURPU|nr:TPT-domain-containing protein [Aureobasidium pullulans]THW00636.1 TPT-domain-containing protein [Aureobasidium pullulans]THW13512.1 TPT-domain-containing protein [Aureobasidium pullulans]THW58923.1 TPT-domain-containing protein [Aureobasidium pullulans]THY10406.1 TPT-domain-containing protein [Aureobasidium pullulans]